ncbi:hypothetical protein GCM10028895_44930 [Pontibacter rugosus]
MLAVIAPAFKTGATWSINVFELLLPLPLPLPFLTLTGKLPAVAMRLAVTLTRSVAVEVNAGFIETPLITTVVFPFKLSPFIVNTKAPSPAVLQAGCKLVIVWAIAIPPERDRNNNRIIEKRGENIRVPPE